MPSRHMIGVGETPSPDGQLDGERTFLTAYAVSLIESAGVQEGVATQDGAAGDEAEHARPGEVGPRWKGARRHFLAARVEQASRPNQHRCR
jgi:hypothetical protein